jgi:hypothetical protein
MDLSFAKVPKTNIHDPMASGIKFGLEFWDFELFPP